MSSSFKPATGFAPQPFTKPADYFALGSEIRRGSKEFIMSRTEINDFGVCPRKWMLAPPKKVTPAMRDGALVDTLLLSPNTFDETYIVHPENYPVEKPTAKDPRTEKPWNMNATFCKDWTEARIAEGKSVCSAEDVQEGDKAIKRLYQDPIIEQLLKHSDRQVLIRAEWHDDATGLVIPFKVLIDILPHAAGPCGTIVADFKRTAEATPDRWQRQSFDQEHFYQAALYIDLVNAAIGSNYTHFANVVSESAAPYEPARRMFTGDFLDLGRMRYRRDLHLYCQCLKHGEWPGYEDFNGDDPNHPVIDGWRQVDTLPWMVKKSV